MKEACSKTTSINVKFKMKLEDEKILKDELLAGNARLKTKVNSLSTQCFQQHEKIKILESNLRRATNVSMRASRVPVRMIGSVSEIIQKADPKYADLERRYDELESEHREALVIIDELEFELGDVISIKRHSFMSVNVYISSCSSRFTSFSCLFFSLLSPWSCKNRITFNFHPTAAYGVLPAIRLITSKWKFYVYSRRMLD